MEAQNYLKTALQPGGKDLLFLMMAATPSVSLGTLALLAEGYWSLQFMSNMFEWFEDELSYRSPKATGFGYWEDCYIGGVYHQTRRAFERIKTEIADTNNESYARFLLTKYLKKLEDINSSPTFSESQYGKLGEIREFVDNLDYYFGDEISDTTDISFKFEMDGETITVVENGIDIETSQPIRTLEYCYLLMADHISTNFIENDRADNHIGYIPDAPLVGEVGKDLVALYYDIYKDIHASRLFIENLANY